MYMEWKWWERCKGWSLSWATTKIRQIGSIIWLGGYKCYLSVHWKINENVFPCLRSEKFILLKEVFRTYVRKSLKPSYKTWIDLDKWKHIPWSWIRIYIIKMSVHLKWIYRVNTFFFYFTILYWFCHTSTWIQVNAI